jgi:phosphoserine/homoserine phosphotransferase
MRLSVLEEKELRLRDIQGVISSMDPLPGAKAFLDWLREEAEPVILSDTFYEFAHPLMKKLDFPTLFCNSLETDGDNFITNYHLRIRDGKRRAVEAFKRISFRVIAMGDSYNDTTMLEEADLGILFRPPENVIREFPEFRVFEEYGPVRDFIEGYLRDS